MPTVWRQAIAEFIGTFALVFIGAGAIVADKVMGGAVGLTGIALAHGLPIPTMVAAHRRGHEPGPGVRPCPAARVLERPSGILDRPLAWGWRGRPRLRMGPDAEDVGDALRLGKGSK